MLDPAAAIARNVAEVRDRIAAAAARAGRSAEEVTLLAVTKYAGVEETRLLVRAGCALLGENRVQELEAKSLALRDEPIRWHMIGTLQRNKVRRVLPLVEMVQSADSPRLVEAIERVAGELALRMPILLEVNISGEGTKHGFTPESVGPFLEEFARLRKGEPACPVEVRGLMGMASLEGGAEAARADFARLRELRDRLRQRLGGAVNLAELSMGMSQDFEVAVEEGATIVRVGSALFAGVGR